MNSKDSFYKKIRKNFLDLYVLRELHKYSWRDIQNSLDLGGSLCTKNWRQTYFHVKSEELSLLKIKESDQILALTKYYELETEKDKWTPYRKAHPVQIVHAVNQEAPAPQEKRTPVVERTQLVHEMQRSAIAPAVQTPHAVQAQVTVSPGQTQGGSGFFNTELIPPHRQEIARRIREEFDAYKDLPHSGFHELQDDQFAFVSTAWKFNKKLPLEVFLPSLLWKQISQDIDRWLRDQPEVKPFISLRGQEKTFEEAVKRLHSKNITFNYT